MAASDPVPASKAEMLNGDVAQNRAVSEATMAKIAGNINAISDSAYNNMTFIMNGYVGDMTNNASDGWGGMKRVTADVEIAEYFVSLSRTGNTSSVGFNAEVYDENGDYVNDLFSVVPSITGNNGSNVGWGRDLENVSTFETVNNTAGHTVDFGTLNLTTLLKGYWIRPFIVNGKNGSKNLEFNLKLKEI